MSDAKPIDPHAAEVRDEPPRRRNSGIIQRARLDDVIRVGASQAMKAVDVPADLLDDDDRY